MTDQAGLLDVVRAVAAQLTQLDRLLEAEFAALSRRDMVTHGQVVANKQRSLDALSELESSLTTLLGTNTPAGLQQGLEAALGNDPATASEWQTFITALQSCAQQNAVNGAIIEIKKQNTTKLLQIMQGGVPSSSVYRRDAKVAEDVASVHLGSA